MMNFGKIFKKEETVLENPLFSEDKSTFLKIKEVLFRKKSKFQKIEILDLEKYGKTLVVGGLIQDTDLDKVEYDPMMTEKVSSDVRQNILILGGGDGNTAEYILGKNPDHTVDIVDIDKEVTKACIQFFNKKELFENPNINLINKDCIKYLKKNKKKYNVVISDLTDNPLIVDDNTEQKVDEFFDRIIESAYEILEDGGYLSIYAGANNPLPKYVDVAGYVYDKSKEVFGKEPERVDHFFDGFGEEYTFVYIQK